MARFAPLLLLLFSLGAAGCGQRVAPVDEELPYALPDRFAAATEAARSGRPAAEAWWTELERPALNETVAAVLQANLDLRIAAASLRQAESAARIAGAARWPQLRAGLDGARSRQNFIGLPIPGAPEVLPITATSYGLSLGVGWELDLWGRIDAAVAAAQADLAAGQAEFQAARQSLAAQTVRVWVARAEAQAQAELAAQRVSIAADVLGHLEARFQRGSASAAEVLEAQAAQTAAETRRAELELAVASQTRALQALLGRYPDAAATTDDQLPTLPAPVPVGVPAELLARRPDLRAAEARYRAAAAREREARAALYPRLSLTASGGTASNALGDLLDGDFRVWGLAGNLTAPLFEGGRLREQVRAQEAGRERATWEFARALLQALLEVEQTLQTEAVLRRTLADLQLNEERAQQRVRLQAQHYQSGTGSLLAWLTARASALDATSARIQVQAALLSNRAALHLALGGGFDDPDFE